MKSEAGWPPFLLPSNMTKAANQWTVNQRKFMLWLALPSDERTPLTQQAFARQIGVGEETLCRWKRLPGFREEVQRLITDSLADDYHDIMSALKRQAKRGSFPHIKTCLEMLGVYTEKRVLDVNILREETRQAAYELGLDPDAIDPDEVLQEAQHILKEGVT